MAVNPLRNYRILLADSDAELSRVVRDMLVEMGFIHSNVVHNGDEAYRALKNEPYDFLISEWNIGKVSGLDLLQRIRRRADSPMPTLPVIMLTGRAEQSDVFAARDTGINEFVVKPFSAKTIYNRIERIIENPRQFVISPSFVGPTRRARAVLSPGVSDRRISKVQPQLQPADVHGALKSVQGASVWLPDFSLKYKLGNNVRLDSLITSAVIAQAQAAVDAISDASLGWIKTNLQDIKHRVLDMTLGMHTPTTAEEIGELALAINSRAGTFGYSRASEIAYLLYLFCRNHLQPGYTAHQQVVQKHVDVLHVILGNQMRGSAGNIGDQMISELKKLAEKFSA